MIEGDCAMYHHYGTMLELHPIVDGRIDQILKDEGAALAILPEGIWFKCSSQRKVGQYQNRMNYQKLTQVLSAESVVCGNGRTSRHCL